MGYGRSIVWGAAVALAAVATAVVAVLALGSAASPMTRPGDRLMVVIAARGGADASKVAQVVAIVDASTANTRVELVDPLATVTVPGTSYDHLRDAYSFGGGEGVARAYAASRGEAPIPFVSLSEEGLHALVTELGGISVDVPADTSVFDGDRLWVFRAGPRSLDASGVVALLVASDGLKADGGSRVRDGVAEALSEAVLQKRPDAAELMRSGWLDSSLSREDLAAWWRKANKGTSGLSITPIRR